MTVIADDARKLADANWMRGLSVPSHWKRQRVKHLVRSMRAGDAITVDAIESAGTYPVYGANGLRGFTSHKTHRGTHVLIGRQGALCGNVHLVSGDFWASEHAIVATPASKIDARWLAALLHVMNLGQYSTSAAQPGIGVGQVAPLVVYVPPLDEQRAIADFLDRETGQIAALVAKQEEFVELLRERREALLDAEFQMVEGKRRTTIRQALVRLTRTPRPGLGVVTAYRDGVVTLRANRRADGYTMSEAEAGYQEVRPGDIVFHALDGFAGAVGISDSLGQCSPVYHVCRPRYDDDPRYLALLIRYLGTSGFLSTQAPSTRQRSVDFRNWGTFARVPLMLPSVEHQMAFVAEFRRQETGIDSLIAKAQEHIALAKERRAALITAAVTGQLDVRTARKAG